MSPVHAHPGWPVHSQVTVLCQLRKAIPFPETPAAPGEQQGADPPTSCVRDQRPALVRRLLPGVSCPVTVGEVFPQVSSATSGDE